MSTRFVQSKHYVHVSITKDRHFFIIPFFFLYTLLFLTRLSKEGSLMVSVEGICTPLDVTLFPSGYYFSV